MSHAYVYKCDPHQSQKRQLRRKEDSCRQDHRAISPDSIHQPIAGFTALLDLISQFATGNGP